MCAKPFWDPPATVSREQVLELDSQVAAMVARPTRIREDIFRLRVLEMDWDIGVVIYEPEDSAEDGAAARAVADAPAGPQVPEAPAGRTPWRLRK